MVGGGLVGTACAFELAQDGQRVVVIDRHDDGRATDAGAGILSPETIGGAPPFVELAELAGDHYRTLIAQLVDAGAPDSHYAVCGALRIAFREFDDSYFAANVAQALARHPDILQRVGADEAHALFPPLGEVRAALFNPRGARVDGRALCAAIEELGRRLGVERRHDTVLEIELDRAGKVGAVRSAGSRIPCGAVVVAGGAWTPEVAATFGLRVGVRPLRGQIVHLGLQDDTSQWPVLQPILSHYVVPWADHRVALGATVEDAGFDPRPTAGGLRQLFSEGLRVSPGLADATLLEVRVGLRPVSDDDLPIIGALDGADGVYVATGHGANGLLLGPVTGRIVADLISGRTATGPPALDLTPFSPMRLATTPDQAAGERSSVSTT